MGSEHIVNTAGVVTSQRTDGVTEARKLVGDLILGLRVDALPTGEAKRLAADGAFYPMTLDESGNLRVALPQGTRIEVGEPEVWRECRNLLEEIRDLLMEMA